MDDIHYERLKMGLLDHKNAHQKLPPITRSINGLDHVKKMIFLFNVFLLSALLSQTRH